MNSDLDHDSSCVFYDYELKAFRKAFDSCYKILKDIDKRADRRQTVQISKSLFDYAERKTDIKLCPQRYYDFKMDEFRICIYLYKGKYSVLCVGFCPRGASSIERKEFVGAGRLFGSFNTPYNAVSMFRRMVRNFVAEYIVDFDMIDEVIPF